MRLSKTNDQLYTYFDCGKEFSQRASLSRDIDNDHDMKQSMVVYYAVANIPTSQIWVHEWWLATTRPFYLVIHKDKIRRESSCSTGKDTLFKHSSHFLHILITYIRHRTIIITTNKPRIYFLVLRPRSFDIFVDLTPTSWLFMEKHLKNQAGSRGRDIIRTFLKTTIQIFLLTFIFFSNTILTMLSIFNIGLSAYDYPYKFPYWFIYHGVRDVCKLF